MRILDILLESQVKDEKYIPAINILLRRSGINLPLEKDAGVYVDFYPSPNQQINSIQDKITGKTADGRIVSVRSGSLYKSEDIKNLATGKEQGSTTANKGELAEGYHSVAVFARLIHRPLKDIDLKDIQAIISRLDNGVPLILDKVKETTSKIADKFELMIRLKPEAWRAFKDPITIKHMGRLIDSIISDANHETSKYAHRYATNKAFDIARVIGDGVSDEAERKTDVSFENVTTKKFAGFSLKVDTTKQVHQVGGGAVMDSKKGKKATAEERFNILAHNLFAVDGRFPLASIDSTKAEFLQAKNIVEMQEIAYKAATDSFNESFQSDSSEKHFLKNLVGALKYWMGRDDPNIKVKQFTNSGTYILNPSLIDKLIDQEELQLVATYTDAAKDNLPKLIIGDAISGKPLVTFRTYKNGKGYIRNYIEKEQLWVDLTQVTYIPNKAPKEANPVKATAVKTTKTLPAKVNSKFNVKPQVTTLSNNTMRSTSPEMNMDIDPSLHHISHPDDHIPQV